jgi:hypothetical protein
MGNQRRQGCTSQASGRGVVNIGGHSYVLPGCTDGGCARVELRQEALHRRLVLGHDGVHRRVRQVDALRRQELGNQAPVEPLLGGGRGVLEGVERDVGGEVAREDLRYKEAVCKVPAYAEQLRARA